VRFAVHSWGLSLLSQSFTAKAAKAAKEKNSLDAKAAKAAKENTRIPNQGREDNAKDGVWVILPG
jgi:hypothetical protein